MTREEFIEILEDEDDTIPVEWEGDNAVKGLKIIERYMPDEASLITGAEHDIIYSVGVDKMIDAGVTKEDATTLRGLNWGVDEDGEYLFCFV